MAPAQPSALHRLSGRVWNMAELHFLLRGLILGFSIAAPVGPIGVLCIRRTLARGRLSGFISGLGAASADAVYGSIAALGLTTIADFFVAYDHILRLIGGLFLCYLGLRTFFETPASLDEQNHSLNGPAGSPGGASISLADYASTFFLTLTNPMTILAFAAIFAGLGLSTVNATYASAALLVSGVFIGSTTWWFFLSTATYALRTRFLTLEGLRWVNRISGLVIAGFGLAAILL
jgi:threonine/homoserine/homoserine lactone efflux protein